MTSLRALAWFLGAITTAVAAAIALNVVLTWLVER